MAIFFTFSPTSNHLHPLQVENCDSNSRLVVDEDDNVKSGLKGLNSYKIITAEKSENLKLAKIKTRENYQIISTIIAINS